MKYVSYVKIDIYAWCNHITELSISINLWLDLTFPEFLPHRGSNNHDVALKISQTTIVGRGLFSCSFTNPLSSNSNATGSPLRGSPPPPLSFWATAISFNETSNRSYGTLGWSSLRPLSKVFSLFVLNYRQPVVLLELSPGAEVARKLPEQLLWNGTSIGRTCLHPRSKAK